MAYFRLFVLVCLQLLSIKGISQYYQFQSYGLEAGLSDPFIYSITQDDRGYLLVGTGEGLGVFDGVSFEMKYTSDSLAEDFVSQLFKSKQGIVWMGHKEGGISYLQGDVIKSYPVNYEINSIITGISEDDQGVVWFASQQGGVFHIDIKSGDQVMFLDEFSGKNINDIAIAGDKELFIATNSGLEHYYLSDSQNELFFSDRYLENYDIKKIENIGREGIAIGTSQSGLFVLAPGADKPVKQELPEDMLIKDLCLDDENNIYVSTFNMGIYKLGQNQTVHYDEANGLPTPNIQTAFMDREGTMWVGSFGGGVYKHSREVFTYYLMASNLEVRDVVVEGEAMYIASSNKVLKILGSDFSSIDTVTVEGIRNITCMYLDRKENLWVGSENNGLFVIDLNTRTAKKWSLTSDYLSSTINDISGDGVRVWVGTYNGLYEIGESNALNHYDITSGLSHNTVNCLFYDDEDEILYIGTESSELSMIENGHLSGKRYTDNFSLLDIYHIDKLSDGGIYLASYGDGVFRFLDGNFEQFSTSQGLASNFCYGLIEDIRKNLWVTHNGYLSRVDIETLEIKVFEEEDGANKAYQKS
ncbi:MAG: hypothetical protein HON99_07350, partial [Crocinitomicaceae bacterium]|nr:hypothetical protein [Crocinitomicaceae bacterium]